jgi:diketogulonate reductase-like aldo/keto reductase
LIEELRAIAGSYGVTPGQVALNWLITFYGDTVLAIPGASKPRHAKESAGAMAFTLTEKELDRLDELSRNCAK